MQGCKIVIITMLKNTDTSQCKFYIANNNSVMYLYEPKDDFLSLEDHNWLVELHNDPEVLKNLTNNLPVTLENHLKWYNSKIVNSNIEKRFIFKINDKNIGFTKFYNIDKINNNCILGADIHKDYRGKNYSKAMWYLMLYKCFTDLQLYRVSLYTAEYNPIAINLYKKVGFIEEGMMNKSLCRNNKYYNCIMFYQTVENFKDNFNKFLQENNLSFLVSND